MPNFDPGDVFAYVNASDRLAYIDGTDVVDKGTWSSSATYAYLDVVKYLNTLYVALQPNTNAAPTAVKDANWSSMAKVIGGQVAPESIDDYARILAYTALTTAWTNPVRRRLSTHWIPGWPS